MAMVVGLFVLSVVKMPSPEELDKERHESKQRQERCGLAHKLGEEILDAREEASNSEKGQLLRTEGERPSTKTSEVSLTAYL